jgi:hypothetical protein
MAEVEKWAANQLTCLVSISAEEIAARAHNEEDATSCFLSTLWYTKLTPGTRLEKDARNMIQYFCTVPSNQPIFDQVTLFNHPDLCNQDPCLFGFLFITLLSHGNSVWTQEEFTREDRIAFFSAQSYLTPLPVSLGENLTMPLLSKPRLTSQGNLEALANRVCSDKCHQRLSAAWQGVFDSNYYTGVTSHRTLKPTLALATLPKLRHDLAKITHSASCVNYCGYKVVDWLDYDLGQLFAELAGYYQDVE